MKKRINKYIILIAICSAILSGANVVSAVDSNQVIVKTNRYVVLDDPNTGTAASGFFDPTNVIGGSYGTNYWNGESTTIRATALITDRNGSPKPGVNVNFSLIYPNNTVLTTTSSPITDGRGIAYYSFNLDEKKYWGYWKIYASANVDGVNVQNSASFALNWWGCPQCHGSQDPGKWGVYTPKSYYTMGYDFHRSTDRDKHIEPMTKGNCITCHTMYNGTSVNRRYNDNTPPINIESEYSPDWHYGKKKCQDCHEGSDLPRGSTGQGKNPDIAGCYDTTGCHTQKNANLSKVNSTTGYVVGGAYRTNYSDIQNSNVAKAHKDTRVECINCHGAGHNITKPYNISSTSNSYTENEQCWTCHTNRITTHQSNSNCVGCHSQNAHNISSRGGDNCIGCHSSDVNISKFGRHANLNTSDGPGIVSNNDCWTCHYNKDMIKNSVYLCDSCHTNSSGIVTVTDPALISGEFSHGSQQCKNCHAPVKYHMNGTVGPKGFMDLFSFK